MTIPKVDMYVKVLRDLGYEHGDIEINAGAIGKIVKVEYDSISEYKHVLQVCKITIAFGNSVTVQPKYNNASGPLTFIKINYSNVQDDIQLFEGDDKTIAILFGKAP